MEVQSSVLVAKAQRPHAVLFPFPAQGHVRPHIQFGQRLAREHGFRITIVNLSYIHNRLGLQKVTGAEAGLHFIDLQEGFPDEYFTGEALWRLYAKLATLQPQLQEVVGKLHTEFPITCIITDLTFTETHKTAVHFGIPNCAISCQCVIATSAKCFGLRLVEEGLLPLPEASVGKVGDSAGTDGNLSRELTAALAREVTCVPGIYPMSLGEYHSALLVSDVSDPNFQTMTGKQVEILHSFDWILANTFEELEESVIEGAQQGLGVKFTPVGPLPLDVTDADGNSNSSESCISSFWPEDKCHNWLDMQKPLSVVYISFGSLANLSKSQLEEFALGLEESQVPFLLVARRNLVDDGGTGEFQSLPPGFIERVKDRALIVSWAPQLKVLGHPAMAGFVTHCGWNSTLEAISMGVPVLTFPYYADQLMNNRYLVSVWKMGLEFERRADNSVGRHEVARKVRMLAAQESNIRVAAQRWRAAARKAVEIGGSSHNNIASFVADMKKKAQECSTISTPEVL